MRTTFAQAELVMGEVVHWQSSAKGTQRMRAGFLPKTGLALLVCVWLMPGTAAAKSAQVIEAEVNSALERLFEMNKAARELGQEAEGILVFPDVTKGGFVIGGSYGVGALRLNGTTEGYYKTTSGSIGLQVGIENRAEVLMFMTEEALNDFRASENWEAGVDGSVSVVKAGASGELTTKTGQAPIVGFIFSNKGLFGGVSLEGAKISECTPE